MIYGFFDYIEVGIDVGDMFNEDEMLVYCFIGKIKESECEYDYFKDDD